MQVSYQEVVNSNDKLVTAAAHRAYSDHSKGLPVNFKDSQASVKSHIVQNENYGNSLLYSPYLAPSLAVITDWKNIKDTNFPVYVHNVARTKYFNISSTAEPQEHFRVNLFA